MEMGSSAVQLTSLACKVSQLKLLALYLMRDCYLTDSVSFDFTYSCYCCSFLATPADVSLLMQLGVDGVFVGSGIFKSGNPSKRAFAMAQTVTHYNDPKKLAELSEDLGQAMSGPAFKNDMYKNKYN